MSLRASYAGITLLALLGSDVVVSAADDNKREPNIKTAEAIELFVSCESNYPLFCRSNGTTATSRKPLRRPVLFWQFRP
jgi:hypothetical protein